MTDKKRTIVVVSQTHWDREWYQPFEEFRMRLVRMMDSLLDLLERDPEYRHFVLDGQTVPVDDYLEIRPDRRAQIERLVRDGRLLVGPGYMLPDEFLIGGEAWVRNLMTGIRAARELGRVMMVGYSPDAFGHIAHLPAILRGFGIDSVLIWRGVGPEATTSEFRWQAPDGSEVLAVHFPYGYGMMAAVPEERGALANVLKSVRNMLEPLATTRYVLLPNGTDHLPAHAGLSGVIRTANEIMDDAEMVHGNYPMFIDLLRKELGEEGYRSLPLLMGEFRNSKRSNILAGVLSTRIWLKQRYQECEDLLARYAEPAAAWVSLLEEGRRKKEDGEALASTRGLLRQAWKQLLQNGPHDSVTGCSVDAVYEDVGARFNHVEQIGESVLFESQRYIAKMAAPEGQPGVVAFNPEHGPRTDFCTVRLPVDSGKTPVRLVDADGRSAPLQAIERGGYSPVDPRERVTYGFVAPEVPGYGYRVMQVEYGEEEGRGKKEEGVIENDVFRISADPSDGTLTVEDKRTGRRFAGLNRFVDGGERGDEYTYEAPEREALVGRPEGLQLRVVEAGPARWTLEVRMTYALPASVTDDRKGRSAERVDCEIVTRASVYPGVARVDIETEVENRARDHRLRVHFPTGIKADRSCAEQHFGVVERPVGLPEHDGTWLETPVAFYPEKSFVDISDGNHGLMLANRGLPEYEALRPGSGQALPEADGTVTIALTLLRCVEWLSRQDLATRRGHAGPGMHTPGAQMIGRWKFQYSLIPHEGGWQNATPEAHRFVRPMRAIRVGRGSGGLPTTGSLIDIEPASVILSALKMAEDDGSIIARMYNIGDEPVKARVRLNHAASGAERVDLNEERPEPILLTGGSARLILKPNEIVTLKFRME